MLQSTGTQGTDSWCKKSQLVKMPFGSTALGGNCKDILNKLRTQQ